MKWRLRRHTILRCCRLCKNAGCPLELRGACVWRPLFRDAAPGSRFFDGLSDWRIPFRLYCLSCWYLILWDLFFPHFFHCFSLPNSLFLSDSHLTVWLCSVSSMSIRVGNFVSCRDGVFGVRRSVDHLFRPLCFVLAIRCVCVSSR